MALTDSDKFYLIPQMEARQGPFMLPSCLETHPTPSHEIGDHAPCNPPSTHGYSLTPAMAPGSPAVPCSEYTHAHETKRESPQGRGCTLWDKRFLTNLVPSVWNYQ